MAPTNIRTEMRLASGMSFWQGIISTHGWIGLVCSRITATSVRIWPGIGST